MKTKTKRSAIKKITREAQVLRHLRQAAGLSMREAAFRLSLSVSTINHIEHGRMDISRFRLRQMVRCYGAKMTEFERYQKGRDIPANLRDDCIALVRRLPKTCLSALHLYLIEIVNKTAQEAQNGSL